MEDKQTLHQYTKCGNIYHLFARTCDRHKNGKYVPKGNIKKPSQAAIKKTRRSPKNLKYPNDKGNTNPVSMRMHSTRSYV